VFAKIERGPRACKFELTTEGTEGHRGIPGVPCLGFWDNGAAVEKLGAGSSWPNERGERKFEISWRLQLWYPTLSQRRRKDGAPGSEDNLFLVECCNQAITRFDPATGILSVIAILQQLPHWTRGTVKGFNLA
jgi:hypothetical protein